MVFGIFPVPSPVPIAALPSEHEVDVQDLMRQFARLLAKEAILVSGVTQDREYKGALKPKIILRDINSSQTYALSQDLGPGSVACNLDTSELALACGAIEKAAQSGVGVIFISKFSKQEASGYGLCDAFRSAMLARVPVVTAVSPHYRNEWRQFSGPLSEDISPNIAALKEWWKRTQKKAISL
ncbi:MAG: DUF2478 domain-containing protein [Methylocystaceae bacterium]|jgi:Protein of unknown function (DUF2478)|nr:DUF2478 domain-containing protein [Methylocystaceae bacterium]